MGRDERGQGGPVPGAAGRIPNFTGAEAAAGRLRALPEWQRAQTLKANPDSAQLPVRQRGPRPAAGVCWQELTDEKIAAIPLLAAQRAQPR